MKYDMTDEAFCKTILEAIKKYPTMAQAADSLGIKFMTFKRLALRLNLYSPNQGGKNVPSEVRMNAKQILVHGVRRSRHHLLRALQEVGLEYKCNECQCEPMWNNKPLVLHIDHINGDHSNNELTNLRFLCPNCHSQTSTHGFKRHHTQETKRKIANTVRKHYAGVVERFTQRTQNAPAERS